MTPEITYPQLSDNWMSIHPLGGNRNNPSLIDCMATQITNPLTGCQCNHPHSIACYRKDKHKVFQCSVHCQFVIHYVISSSIGQRRRVFSMHVHMNILAHSPKRCEFDSSSCCLTSRSCDDLTATSWLSWISPRPSGPFPHHIAFRIIAVLLNECTNQ